MKKLIIMLTLLVALPSCEPDKEETFERIPFGGVESIKYQSSVWEAENTATIKTTKGIIRISSHPPMFIGDKARLKIYSNGKQFICFESLTYCYQF